MGAAVTAALPVIEAVSSLFSVGMGIFGMTAGKGGNVNVPTLPTYTIPTAQLQQLNSQIAANNQLGASAQQAAQQALTSYSQGQLSPAYAGQYEEEYNTNLSQLQNQLAGMGFTQNSTQYQQALQQFNASMASVKSQMLQSQLTGALQSAGLSDQQIQSQLSAWQSEGSVTAQNAQTQAEQTQLQIEADKQNAANNQQMGAAAQGIATGLQGFGSDVGNILNPSSGTSTSSLSSLSLPSASSVTNGLNNAASLTQGYSQLQNMGTSGGGL